MAAEPICRYCRASGKIVAATQLDHLLALSLGGDDRDDNLVPTCQPCNDAKGRDERRYLDRGYSLTDVTCDPALAEWFRLAAIHDPSFG